MNASILEVRNQFTLVVTTLAWAAAFANGSVGAASLSDAFAGRVVLDGATASFDGVNNAATAEIGEPNHGGTRRRTLWGAWKAPGTGNVTIDTFGSTYNTVLAVYAGQRLDGLRMVAQNDDLTDSSLSRVTFPTLAGETYSIAVDGEVANSSSVGTAKVNVSFVAINQAGAVVGTDHFQDRQALAPGLSALGACNTRFFGIDTFEPARIGNRDQTAWWRWIAPTSGTVTLDTLQSNFDTILTVYVGTRLDDLTEVAQSADTGNIRQSLVSFQARAGQEYQIHVDGEDANSTGWGNVLLRLNLQPNGLPGGVPASDNFETRGELAGSNAEGVSMNRLFSAQAFEPNHGSSRRATAWWSWTAPETGLVLMRTEGSEFDTTLTVYTGDTLSKLQRVAFNDDVTGAKWSEVRFEARRGDRFAIVVDGANANSTGFGNIRLRVDQATPPSQTLAVYPAMEVELPGVAGARYQLQSSEDFVVWLNVGEVRLGEGKPIRVFDSTRGTTRRYYRYLTY